ncbi:MAG: DNA replication/repair protein RecF [Ruminococcus sp.]|nr:DNA replication/repair protein RecF [Ruminococcus sp.]
MRVLRFSADGFRNLKEISLEFDPELNILCGRNAQGKTNIMEALWLCSGERSFRGAKDKELIGTDADRMSLLLDFEDSRRTQTVSYSMLRRDMKNKKLELNGVNVKTPSGLFGAFGCVVFTPEDLELSKGAPDNRRSFIDLSVSQLKPSYRGVVEKYRHILDQRNLHLKHIGQGRPDDGMLDIWDMQLAQMGSYITVLRYNYCKKLQRTAEKLFSELSGGGEELVTEYHSTVFKELDGRNDYRGDLFGEYIENLTAGRSEDLRAGFTLRGVHRDELKCSINGMNAKEFASQGQHRSIALILKLSQAYILSEETGEYPCILLDDVLSELDHVRRAFIMEKIRGMQVVITCCEEETVKGCKGRFFRVEGGRIIS